MNLYEKERNGSQKRTATTKFVVSRWYIPGGYMYDSARNIDIFFDNEEDANAYAKEYEMPPEMAPAMTSRGAKISNGKHSENTPHPLPRNTKNPQNASGATLPERLTA